MVPLTSKSIRRLQSLISVGTREIDTPRRSWTRSSSLTVARASRPWYQSKSNHQNRKRCLQSGCPCIHIARSHGHPTIATDTNPRRSNHYGRSRIQSTWTRASFEMCQLDSGGWNLFENMFWSFLTMCSTVRKFCSDKLATRSPTKMADRIICKWTHHQATKDAPIWIWATYRPIQLKFARQTVLICRMDGRRPRRPFSQYCHFDCTYPIWRRFELVQSLHAGVGKLTPFI